MAEHDPQETDHQVLHPHKQGTEHGHADRDDHKREQEDTEEVMAEKSAAEVPPPTRTPSMNTPRVRQTALTTDLEPERSRFGMYFTVIAIVLLLIFGLWQFFSKTGMRAQISELQRENTALKDQVAQLQNQPAPSVATPSQPTQPTTPAMSTYYPVLYRDSVRQQIGQLITSPANTNLAAVTLRGNGGLGDNAELAIFETDNPASISETERPAVSKLFNASQIPTGEPFAVQLDRPYSLRESREYFIVVRPSSTNAQANIGYSAASSGSGEMWVYTRKVDTNGLVLDPNPSWQMIPNVSLTADLRISE